MIVVMESTVVEKAWVEENAVVDATADEDHEDENHDEEAMKVVSDIIDDEATPLALDTDEDNGGSPEDDAYSELLERESLLVPV